MRSIVALTAAVIAVAATGSAQQTYTERMAHEHAADKPIASPAAEVEPRQPVTTETVTYATVNGAPVSGYLARPRDASGPLPGIIVIHEWWGLNDNIRSMARRLAGEGYEVLAVDLYGGAAAQTPDAARALMQRVMDDPGPAQDNLRQAAAYLRDTRKVRKLGVIGWCFGGGWSLQTALMLPDRVDATVMYYGRLETDRQRLKALRAPLLGLFGAADTGIPVAGVRQFEATLKELGKPAVIHVYEGAAHAFANPSGTAYKADAAADAWLKTVAFLAEHLK